jgi:hypothetical protein
MSLVHERLRTVPTSGALGGSRLIFLHIPKTAGTTLKQVLVRQYGFRGLFEIYGNRLPEAVQEIQQLGEDRLAALRAFVGHMPFGLHELLPEPAAYISLLRHPVDRLVSHYYYVLRARGSPLHEMTVSNHLSLEEYVKRGPAAPLFNNGQTRLLGSRGMLTAEPATEETFEAAKRNLDRFALVGLTERFDETLLILKRLFGWHWPVYEKEKVGTNRPKRNDLSAQAVHTILERNQLDLELYRIAAARFDEAVDRRGVRLRGSVTAFRWLNTAAHHSAKYRPNLHPRRDLRRLARRFI